MDRFINLSSTLFFAVLQGLYYTFNCIALSALLGTKATWLFAFFVQLDRIAAEEVRTGIVAETERHITEFQQVFQGILD